MVFDSLDVGRDGEKIFKNETKNSGLCNWVTLTKQGNRVREMDLGFKGSVKSPT